MLKLLCIFLPVPVLTACSNGSQDVNLQEKHGNDTAVHLQEIIFAEPQIIDSSAIVIYPLVWEKESNGSSYGSSSAGQNTSYWNLIFYNTKTGTQHLLVADKKVLIYSIDFGSSSSSSYASGNISGMPGVNIYKYNIIYTVTTNDFNKNKKLDQNDPTYLFVSNRDGTNFRQISPDNYNIKSWNVIRGTSKIILQGQQDRNNDKKFDDHDVSVPLIVDLNSQKTASEAFKPDVIDSLKKKLLTIWKK